ncbi:BTB/POZ domain-containing protein [Dorcoceras hygrometricum]|uniref:BTB/POZ domain-containing protein n=1 Tax=Dorcoceras hygrometricum TaxID=472368 RepID=A0A2Z7C5F2_9LAMI|nr:BTB/POZ domain-containing protein [Dorcoceras hygrometricum]
MEAILISLGRRYVPFNRLHISGSGYLRYWISETDGVSLVTIIGSVRAGARRPQIKNMDRYDRITQALITDAIQREFKSRRSGQPSVGPFDPAKVEQRDWTTF